MIITIKGANFKDSNIGTLSSYTVRFNGAGVSGSPTSIAKNEEGTQASANYVGTITVSSSYTYKSVSSVTVGGTALSTSDYTVSGMNITIPANKITGNVVITVATEKVNTGGGEDTPTMYTLTINPTPSTATVTLTASGYSQSGNSITVPANTSVAWRVTASGYTTQSDTHTVTKTETKNVTLSAVSGGGSGTINAGLTLYQGYVDNKTVNDELNTRVKTDMLQGPYTIELNSGYLIRAIYEYNTTSVSNGGTAIVTSADQKTSYTYSGNKYTYITFCKTDATASISPTENIVKTYTINEYTPDTPETTDKITVNGIDIKLGQVLSSSIKADNTARAYTENTINDKTSLTTTGDFVMIPLFDADDNLSNGSGTFYTNDSTNAFQTASGSGSLKYHSNINVADLIAAAPDTNLRVMFKKNSGSAINLSELQSALTII